MNELVLHRGGKNSVAARQADFAARWRRAVLALVAGIAIGAMVSCASLKRAYVYVWTTAVHTNVYEGVQP